MFTITWRMAMSHGAPHASSPPYLTLRAAEAGDVPELLDPVAAAEAPGEEGRRPKACMAAASCRLAAARLFRRSSVNCRSSRHWGKKGLRSLHALVLS